MASPSSNSDFVIYYALYLEQWHDWIINISRNFLVSMQYNQPGDGPFDYELPDPAIAYLGINALADFPSLYDMFGKFVGGLDVEGLNKQITHDEIYSPATLNAVSTEFGFLYNDLDVNFMPGIIKSASTVNAALITPFFESLTLLSDDQTKILNNFDATMKLKGFEHAQSRWARHLDWNTKVVDQYSNAMRFYFANKMEFIQKDLQFKGKQTIWPFTVLDNYYRDYIQILLGAASTSASKKAGASTIDYIGIGLAVANVALKVAEYYFA